MADGMAETKDINGGGEGLLTASLDQLQSSDYRQILDVVDSLRTCGLGTILQLPQIVVCGDQSSGKSSVLEAITEVPFPRKENLCTRVRRSELSDPYPVLTIARTVRHRDRDET